MTLVSRARIWLKTVLKTLLACIGEVLRLLGPRKTGLRVLLYHRVNPHPFASLGPVSREITVRPNAFARQLGHLRRSGFHSISPDELGAMLRGEFAFDPRAVVITFDDGYEDNLTWAAPLLREYGFQAIMFVTTDRFGKDSSEAGWGSDAPGCGHFLTRDQLAQWLAAGMYVGSHTHTHRLATQIADDELFDEFARSRRILEAACGTTVRLLAFPDGDFDARAESAAARAGYEASFTTVPGINTRVTPLHALRRTEVSASDTFFMFRMKLRGALDWLWFKEARAIRSAIRFSSRILLRIVARERA